VTKNDHALICLISPAGRRARGPPARKQLGTKLARFFPIYLGGLAKQTHHRCSLSTRTSATCPGKPDAEPLFQDSKHGLDAMDQQVSRPINLRHLLQMTTLKRQRSRNFCALISNAIFAKAFQIQHGSRQDRPSSWSNIFALLPRPAKIYHKADRTRKTPPQVMKGPVLGEKPVPLRFRGCEPLEKNDLWLLRGFFRRPFATCLKNGISIEPRAVR